MQAQMPMQLSKIRGQLIHLDLDVKTDSTVLGADTIMEIYKHCFEDGAAKSEFVERERTIMIPRHMEDDKSGVHIASRIGVPTPQLSVVPQSGRSLKLQSTQLGLLDTFYFDDDPRVGEEFPDDCVEIEIKASTLNFRDIIMVNHPFPLEELSC